MPCGIRLTSGHKRTVHKVARAWTRGVAAIAATTLLGLVSILLGLNSWAGTVPLFSLIRQHPILSIAIGGIFATVSIVALVISLVPLRSGENESPDLPTGWQVPRLVISTAMSVMSTTALMAVLITMVARPSWCSSLLCPPVRTLPVLNPTGIHDQNLEVYFTALETAWYVIPGDPSQYSLSNLPRAIGAVRIDQAAIVPFRAVIGVHNLHQERLGILVERVAILIQQVPPMSNPLNVWANSAPLDYHSNPYHVLYGGQNTGEELVATYVPLPFVSVQLAPGEADELGVQIESRVLADIRFRVQVTYRIADDSRLYTLTLPQVFECAFSSGANWHPFSLKDGHFVPIS